MAKSNSKKIISTSLLIYGVSLVLTFGLQQFEKALDSQTYSPSDPWYRRVIKPEFWYDKVTSFGPIKPKVGQLRVIQFEHGVEPENSFGMDHRCTARLFLSKLLAVVDKHHPSVIFIDRYFSSDPLECPASEDGTGPLETAIGTASSPIVVAEDNVNFSDVGGYCKDVTLPPDTVVLKPKLDFTKDNKGVVYGLTRLNEDIKKIPLGWFAYGSCDEARVGKNRRLIPTTYLVVTYLAKSTPLEQVLTNTGLKDSFRDVHHPYIGFLRPSEIPHYDAIELLCGKIDTDAQRWKQCNEKTSDDAKLSELHGQVVVIGVREDSDIQKTVVGQIAGFELDAIYIAGLLSEHPLFPVPLAYQILLGLFWFAVIEIIFKWGASRPELALIMAFVTTLVLAFVVYSFLLIYFGIFAVLVPPSVIAIIGKWLSLRLDGNKEKDVSHENQARAAGTGSSGSITADVSGGDSGVSQQQTGAPGPS